MNVSTLCRTSFGALLGAWMIGLPVFGGTAFASGGTAAPCREVLDAIVTQVLARQPASPCPGTITGEIRHHSLRTSWGWLILLFQNPAAASRPQPSSVTVDLRPLRPCRIRELLSGVDFENDRFEITVAPEQYRILQLLVGQFEPEYFWEYFEVGYYDTPPVKRFLCEWHD